MATSALNFCKEIRSENHGIFGRRGWYKQENIGEIVSIVHFLKTQFEARRKCKTAGTKAPLGENTFQDIGEAGIGIKAIL